jgi:hypothetical protein
MATQRVAATEKNKRDDVGGLTGMLLATSNDKEECWTG